MENFSITGTPGAKYQLKFVTDAIDTSKPSNKAQNATANPLQSTKYLSSTDTSVSSSIDF